MWTERGLPPGWTRQTVAELGSHSPMTVQTGPFGAQLHSEDYVDEGIPFILIRNLQGNSLDTSDMPHITCEDARRLSLYRLMPGDVVFSRVGRVGSCFLVEEKQAGWVISGQMLRIRLPEDAINHRYLIHILRSKPVQDRITGASVGSTRQSINTRILESLSVITPPLPEQRRIAEILDAADEAIRHTERVIAKLKAVKAGLLHDLLTRGLDEHGHLRDPQARPEQFKDSPLGRIPKEWNVRALRDLVESAVDGPFGSNLKTEHYISSPGVRVVRLQNIGTGFFNDTDKSYVSDAHARTLWRHAVVSGDLLIASLGDDNHPIGRACLYPPDIIPGIVKADCFRFCLRRHLAVNAYMMYVLNCPLTRGDINALGHGVTRDRVTLITVQQIRTRVPPVAEQTRIVSILDTHDARIRAEEAELAKLRQVKRGLMDDLLTGRVRVSP